MTQSYGALRIVSDTQKIYGVCTCTHAHLLTRSNEDGSSALFTLSAWARRLTSLKRKRCARKGLDSAVTSELTWVPTEGTSWDNELSWGAVIPLASMSPSYFCLSNCKFELAIHWDGEECGWLGGSPELQCWTCQVDRHIWNPVGPLSRLWAEVWLRAINMEAPE
jgi:hypothetical protein